MSSTLDRDLDRRARYSQGAGIYRILPAAVARPRSVAELRDVLAAAVAAGLPITPRGAGSAMGGGNLGEGVVIDLTQCEAGRCTIDAPRALAEVSPSLPLALLQEAAGLHGLRFPPDPSSAAWATLGGMASTNAAGARSVRYGSVRGWIAGLTLETLDGPLVLARGVAPDPSHPVTVRWWRDVMPRIAALRHAIPEAFPAVRKNAFGYALDHYLRSGDLLDLVIGSEGTLGVISALTCRLHPVPRHRVALRLMLPSRSALVPVIEALRHAEASSIEFLDRTFLQLIDPALAGAARDLVPRSGGVILADLEGDDHAALLSRAGHLLGALGPHLLHGEMAGDRVEIDELWRIRHGASPALARLDDGRRSLQVIEDGVVPPARLPDYLDAIERIATAEGIAVVLFGHAGDGHVHANLLPDITAPDWEARVGRIYERVHAALFAMGGSPSGEHGTGRLRAPLLEQGFGPEIVALFRAIRAAFDPGGWMNPGVILSDGTPPLRRLKVGTGVLALPAAAEARLREIEAGAGWGRSRWDAT